VRRGEAMGQRSSVALEHSLNSYSKVPSISSSSISSKLLVVVVRY